MNRLQVKGGTQRIDLINCINSLSWLLRTFGCASKIMVSPFSREYGSHAGKLPSTLGLPVVAKLSHAELIFSASAFASSLVPVQCLPSSIFLNASGISRPWKEPLVLSSTVLFQVNK